MGFKNIYQCETFLSGLPRSGKNIWKMKFFAGQGKVREFCGWLEKFRKDLEKTRKGREKSGNLKINGYGRQCSENSFVLFKRDKDVLSHEIVYAHLPPHWGLLSKERICSLFPLRVSPKFEMIAPFK